MYNPRMTTITFNLDEELAYKLRQVALQQLLSDEEVLQRALKEYLQVAPPAPRRNFSDLYGVWKGVDFSYEEIKANEYRLDANL